MDPENYWQIWCHITMCFKQSSLVYASNCHIIYVSITAKDRNEFSKIVPRYDFKRKLRWRAIFVIFIFSGLLTTHKAITKSCKIGILSNEPYLWHVVAKSCGYVQPFYNADFSWRHNINLSDPAFLGHTVFMFIPLILATFQLFLCHT